MITNEPKFYVQEFPFNREILTRLDEIHYANDKWPVVYILVDKTKAYVGESKDLYTRLSDHLKNNKKNKLTTAYIISSKLFNRSVTHDLEANLIRYMTGDQKYHLINDNNGFGNQTYFQDDHLYWPLFQSIWEELLRIGAANNDMNHIANDDVFKYSPYKKLEKDQSESLLAIMRNLLDNTTQNTIVEGGAGTGKTILAIFLFKLLHTDIDAFNFSGFRPVEAEIIEVVKALKLQHPKLKMALVIPMSSFRRSIQKVFKRIPNLKVSMVVGPTAVAKKKYDIVIVDEAHRLRNSGSGTYIKAYENAAVQLGFGKGNSTELKWLVNANQKNKLVLFYDQNQQIKPTDILKNDFDELKDSPNTNVLKLKIQKRLQGGDEYVRFVHDLLKCTLTSNFVFSHRNYELLLFKNMGDLIDKITRRESEKKLSRLVAGYAWDWKSAKNPGEYDIEIDGCKLRWNSLSIDWINSANAINEVGCIHTVQGYDLNYAGIIFGNEITYDNTSNKIIIKDKKYRDKNGKKGIKDPEILKYFITNIYLTLLQRGIKGTYIYVCDPALRAYFEKHIKTAVIYQAAAAI